MEINLTTLGTIFILQKFPGNNFLWKQQSKSLKNQINSNSKFNYNSKIGIFTFNMPFLG